MARKIKKVSLGQRLGRLRQEKEMMRENFITLVSHQLRSPLTSVKLYFSVIREGFAGDVTDKQKEIIRKAGDYIDSLLKLINDWLDMSRVEAGRIRDKSEPVSLAAVLTEAAEVLKSQAQAKKVALQLNLAGNLPQFIGDPNCLKEAFLNLISNAIIYNRDGGTVIVTAKEQDDDLVVEVSDTGIGISKENLHFIFDEFFRVKNKETQHISGTGLGLPIAKKIIEAHNGCVKVDSELGVGTTFSIILPKAQQ